MDSLGFFAYAFVLLSASTNDARWFRLALLGSNFFFVAYGFALELMPILIFNIALGVINSVQVYRAWHKTPPLPACIKGSGIDIPPPLKLPETAWPKQASASL